MMVQNVGYEKSSLLNVFGWVSDNVSKALKFKDYRSFMSASRKHKLEAETTHHHRRKEVCQVVGEDGDRAGGVDQGARGGRRGRTRSGGGGSAYEHGGGN